MSTRLPGLIWLLSLMMACGPAAEQSAQRPPNVLLILTDDQGYGDLGVHGNDTLQTPVLDQLANEGVRLDNFFVSAVCAPTRASLLTGRYHLRTGTFWVTRGSETMRSEETTLAEMFKANGYTTGCFGKWHNGAHYPNDPIGQGFDHFTGFLAGHWNNYFNTRLLSDGEWIQSEGYIADVLTDEALNFMQINRNEPFFCYVPYNTPHSPWQVPDAYFDKYKGMGLSDELACAYGMVDNIDENVGRMLTYLEHAGLADETIVIFITDNGPNTWRYNAGMKGRKAWVNDGGTRVPCLIRWPGQIKGGRVSRELTAHIDILPTLKELCGLTQMPGTLPVDGTSLAGLILGEVDTLGSRSLFTHHNNAAMDIQPFPGAMRTRDFRFVGRGQDKFELTSMADDPGEEQDLSAEYPEVLENMKAAYLEWFQAVTGEGMVVPPVPVGYSHIDRVVIPAHEAFLTGEVSYRFTKHAWANDWITNWTDTDASAHWDIDVHEAVRYWVSLQYTASQQELGAVMNLKVGGEELSARIERSFIPEKVETPDRAVKSSGAYDQSWGVLFLGELSLKPGVFRMELKASEIPGSGAGEIKGLIFEKIEPEA